MLESKEILKKNYGDMSKGPRSQFEEVSMDQIWNNLGMNMNYSVYKLYIYSLYNTYTNKPYL